MVPFRVVVLGTTLVIGDSGRKIEIHFCPDCGSSVFCFAGFVPDLIGIAFGTVTQGMPRRLPHGYRVVSHTDIAS
jgi:hypothetical protein